MALRKRHILLIVALLLAFIGMATAAISILNGNVISPSESLDIDAYKISGIDVSAHNGNIDFAKARAVGTEFVFVKATEGATFRDSAMNSNLRKAHEAGLKTGVYHFFRFDVDGVKQAHNLLKAIAGRPLSLPLVIDVESHTNPYTPADIVTRKIHDMVDELTAYGYPVIIYSNKKDSTTTCATSLQTAAYGSARSPNPTAAKTGLSGSTATKDPSLASTAMSTLTCGTALPANGNSTPRKPKKRFLWRICSTLQ